jgi:hypothetical protein
VKPKGVSDISWKSMFTTIGLIGGVPRKQGQIECSVLEEHSYLDVAKHYVAEF